MPVADAVSLLALSAGQPPPGTAEGPEIIHPSGLLATPVSLEAEELDALVAKGRAQACFDRYLLMLPASPSQRAETIECFFSWLADTYEEVVDRRRNIENIEALQSALVGAGATEGRILDFGCGTGLSRFSAVVPRDRLLAFDSGLPMRRQASRSGLEVLTPRDLGSLPPGAIAGAFASYVLHLGTEDEHVVRCIAAMGERPLLVANFHKGNGRQSVDRLLGQLGLVPQPLPSHPERHGPAILYRRA